ncbi:PTS sugar transporter subunit IIA [Chromobacterium piscinae]|uniref:PTS sugar transporter subunit IIA n=1 Tax=Chromobacterium piscinae TaxID=686831 RepID=A0ABV0H4E0_9NEIS|nr:PTS sugar transporter subunit IIA [Chromobacterium vaccinii]MBX9348432.1 PTS sugar transporter subunit IIA [Chromobacterium vaccinii]MBX9356664.1 PTS sugar transporter subunit IIA [Chromobacterium vaccinii]NHQ80937.1 PTS sugar transporter subunit IIA [Chromobacterium vaccinii]
MQTLADICRGSDILLDVDISNKRQLFEYAARQLGQRHALNAPALQAALQQREETGSTALGHGLALPHARIAGLADVRALFLGLKRGLDFDALDGEPVHSLLVLLLPRDTRAPHLQLLAEIARVFGERPFRAELAACRLPDQVDSLFQRWSDPEPSNDPHFMLDSNRYFLDAEASLRPDYSVRRKVTARF